MNHFIILCLIAFVAEIQTIPTPISDNYHNQNVNATSEMDEIENFLLFENDLQDDQIENRKHVRQIKNIIDGTVHRIKAAGVNYRQRLRNGQCLVEYDGQLLNENSVVQIRRKLYRVEDCLLERVFHACGPNLLLMLNVVCRVVEKHQTTTVPLVDFRRSTTPPVQYQNNRRLRPPRANKTPRVITESCCENLCTISELTRYCHR